MAVWINDSQEIVFDEIILRYLNFERISIVGDEFALYRNGKGISVSKKRLEKLLVDYFEARYNEV